MSLARFKSCRSNIQGCLHSQVSTCSPFCGHSKLILTAVTPIALWLILFTCAQYIPSSWRPTISVELLPSLDSFLFDNSLGLVGFSFFLVLSGWAITNSHLATLLVFVPLVMRCLRDLALETTTTRDVLAFIPYGVLHYISPALFAIWLLWFAGVGPTVVFAQAFGVQNSLAVLTQILFPTAAPWYNDLYGFAPASYSMPGNPGGLARVDSLFGTKMYQNAFNSSPLVFGAMPSLHSGFAVLIMLFAMHYSKRVGAVFMVYVCWQWWATMYLRHHYMMDLIVGASFSSLVYLSCRRRLRRLPTINGAGYKLLQIVVTNEGGDSKSIQDNPWIPILKSRRAGDRDDCRESESPLL